MGRQIAEGGFSYVFEAFPVGNNSNSGTGGGGGRRRTASRMLLTQRSSSTLTSADSTTNSKDGNGRMMLMKYALKRINCSDHEIIQACRHEAGVHRSLPSQHPNLLELLGLKFDNISSTCSSSSSSSVSSSSHDPHHHNEYNLCYMLFPYIPNSLRGEVTNRNILYHADPSNKTRRRRRQPFATEEILQLFGGLVDALIAMHNSNISHRDIKLENVLLQYHHHHHGRYQDDDDDPTTTTASRRRGRGGKQILFTPVVMDFGSAGALCSKILNSRQQVLTVVENAASNTTMTYRPPELFEGGMRHGVCEMLDYGKVDVWSLGCVLFGLMHGTSPFEMEFSRSNDNTKDDQYGLVRIVECTHLKILEEVPFPPWAYSGLGNGGTINDDDDGRRHHGRNGKYPMLMYNFIQYMVHHDRMTRPNIHEVAKRFEELYLELVGERWISYDERRLGCCDEAAAGKEQYDDFDSLITSRDFV